MTHQLFPDIEPFHTQRFPVSSRHTLYIEQVGSLTGMPVVFLHGGPGGGIDATHRRFFNPERFHAILFDQRGSGQSTPFADVVDNTTQDCCEDLERIREHLNIKQWLVVGGSWGSTLALAYAERYPERVLGLVLRGIFLGRPKELDWLYQHGASMIFPDYWQDYLNFIPEDERDDLLSAYNRRIFSEDKDLAETACRIWTKWEGMCSKLLPSVEYAERFEQNSAAKAFARIESHYFINNLFLKPNELLSEAYKLKNIPTHIIHGRYDVVTPIDNAFCLAEAMPHAKLHVLPAAGHSLIEEQMIEKHLAILDDISKGWNCA